MSFIHNVEINHEEFVKLWNDGVLGKEMAKIMGVSDSVISEYAKKHRMECPIRIKKSQIDHNEFLKLWNEGISIDEISEKLGVGKYCIYAYARKYKDEFPKRNKKINHNYFVELWNSGISHKEIAEKFGIAPEYVFAYAAQHRDTCPKRISETRKKIKHSKFVKMWNEGFYIDEIAKAFGITEEQVEQYANENKDVCF